MSAEVEQNSGGTRTMSSFQVFSRFVTFDPATNTDSGERILSRECFQMWLDTRDGEVVHPEESFRRTLIAHIRGVYGRKPFSPAVEASLLGLLRESCRGKESVNAWERCFPLNSSNIGKRGFNKLGFHEEQRKKIRLVGGAAEDGSTVDIEAKIDDNDNIIGNDGPDMNKFKGKKAKLDKLEKKMKILADKSCDPIVCDCAVFSKKQLQKANEAPRVGEKSVAESGQATRELDERASKITTKMDPTISSASTIPSVEFLRQSSQEAKLFNGLAANNHNAGQLYTGTMSNAQQEQAVALVQFLHSQATSGTGLMAQFSQVFLATRTTDDIMRLFEISRKKGFDVIPPAVAMFLSGTNYALDPRLDLEYLVPFDESECKFFENEPVGTLLHNFKTWLVEEADVVSKGIFFRELQGCVFYEFMESPLEVFVASIRFMPKLLTRGVCWVRLRARRGDGKRLGLLIKLVIQDSDRAIAYVQDQSGVKPHLLAIPMFI